MIEMQIKIPVLNRFAEQDGNRVFWINSQSPYTKMVELNLDGKTVLVWGPDLIVAVENAMRQSR